MLNAHLLNHEGSREAEQENRASHLTDHLRWSPEFASQVVIYAQRNGLVAVEGDHLRLTPAGRQRTLEHYPSPGSLEGT